MSAVNIQDGPKRDMSQKHIPCNLLQCQRRKQNNFQMGMGQNHVPLVNIKIAGKWMFIPLKMVCIGIDPYPNQVKITSGHGLRLSVLLFAQVCSGSCFPRILRSLIHGDVHHHYAGVHVKW